MKLVSTKSVANGAVLAQSIYNENGVILLSSGVVLTNKIILRLRQYGITYVYIEDKYTQDVKIEPLVSDNLGRGATRTIKNIFTDIKKEGVSEKSYILHRKGDELKEVVRNLTKELRNQNKSLSLLTDIYLTDNYLFQHSLNVTMYSLAIGKKLNLSNDRMMTLGMGALLHDIGKIFIDSSVLHKPGQLTNEEFEIMKTHTTLGYEYLRKNIDIPAVVAHCAFNHHERLDGSGYPRGLVGEELNIFARILGVADVFDAVTSNRVYRDAMLPHEGLEILYAGAVRLFDKSIVEAFKQSIVVYPVGITVQLSDGRVGVVVDQNSNICDRPIIRILEEKEVTVETPYEVNLAEVHNLIITSVLM